MTSENEERPDLDAAVEAVASAALEDNGDASISRETDPATAAEAVKAMKALDAGGTNAIREEIETFRMAEGKDRKGDLYSEDANGGLDILREMIKVAIDKSGGVESKRGRKWRFRTVPHEQFGRTLDDVLLAFLLWAGVDETEGGESDKSGSVKKKKGGINVSKAFRRLSAYAAWMEETGDDLLALTAESVQGTWDRWKMKLTYDKHRRLVWWFDLAAIDVDECRKIPPVESLRLFVWLSHLIMFDADAQRNGMVFGCDFARMGFWALMSFFTIKLGLKLDRLTIGVLPIKMKRMYMLGSPTWWDVLLGIMSPFISKKLRKRIVTIKEKECNLFVNDLGGAEFIPAGFHDCGGTMETDIVAETYFS